MIWLAACTTAEPDPATGWTGGATIAPDPVPERFSSPVRWLTGPDGRPIEALRHAVCHDRPGARDALVAALAETPPDERAVWGAVTGHVDCVEPGFCEWVTAQLAAAPRADADVWRVGLWSCPGEAAAREILEHASDEVVVGFVANAWRRREPLPWVDRLEVLARARVADPGAEPFLAGLGRMEDPRGRRLLRAIGGEVEGAARDRAYAALDGSLDSGEALLAERACHALGRSDCVGRTAVSDLTAAVAAGLDPRGLPARYPHLRSALSQSLLACVGAGDPRVAHACGEALTELDPAVAALAFSAVRSAAGLGDLVTDPAATDAALAACGLPVPPGAGGVTVAERLRAGGHALQVRAISVDDGGAGLPYRLSALAGLDDAEYDVLAPVAFDGDRAFLGWRGRVRHRVVATSRGGWDVEAATRLVNAQLAFAERPERVIPDPTFTWWTRGTPEALACLRDAGLATFAPAPAGPDGEEEE